MESQITTKNFYDVMIRLAFLTLIIAWCLMILFPFASIILWGLIFALAFAPLHVMISKAIGNRPKWASFIIVIGGLIILLLPGWLFVDSLTDGIKNMRDSFHAGTLTIPAPPEKVKSWPLIGENVYAAWYSASIDIGDTFLKHKDQLIGIGRKIFSELLNAASGVFQLVVSLVIAGFLLITPGAGPAIKRFFRKIAGERGDEFALLANKTVGNVVKGILGVAFIQSLFIGIGLLLAGVPAAGIWTLVVFIFAVLQIPPTLVVIPVIVWLFSNAETLPAILWSIYLIIGGMSDNILKPILLGKGASVPMLVIFLGVIGGFMLSGFIGLFTGAIVVSLGYKLLIAWIAEPSPETTES